MSGVQIVVGSGRKGRRCRNRRGSEVRSTAGVVEVLDCLVHGDRARHRTTREQHRHRHGDPTGALAPRLTPNQPQVPIGKNRSARERPPTSARASVPVPRLPSAVAQPHRGRANAAPQRPVSKPDGDQWIDVTKLLSATVSVHTEPSQYRYSCRRLDRDAAALPSSRSRLEPSHIVARYSSIASHHGRSGRSSRRRGAQCPTHHR